MQTASTFTLIIIYVVLFVLELSNRDPAATYHTYESDSARVLVAVRIVLLIWFVWCVRRSAMNEEGPGVARFFKQFAVVHVAAYFFANDALRLVHARLRNVTDSNLS